jgi:hypothetical protein
MVTSIYDHRKDRNLFKVNITRPRSSSCLVIRPRIP